MSTGTLVLADMTTISEQLDIIAAQQIIMYEVTAFGVGVLLAALGVLTAIMWVGLVR